MLEYQSVDELTKAAINANLEADAPPCRLKGLERASRWVVKEYEESHGASGLTLQSLEEVYGSLFRLFDAGGIARSTFHERRRLMADMIDLAEYGSIDRSADLSPSWRKGDNPLSRPVPLEVKGDPNSIIGLSFAVLDEMERRGYSANTMRCYKMCAFPRLIAHFKELGTDRYSDEALESFIGKVEDGFCAGAAYYDILRPAALHVRSMHDGGGLYVRGGTFVEKVKSGRFGAMIAGFVEWRESAGAKRRTVENDVRATAAFLETLCPAGPEGLRSITREAVRSALASMADGRPPRYVCRTLSSIRAFATFVEERHPELPAFGSWIGRNPRVVKGRPIEGYTAEQVDAMIASTDCTTAMGMRDRAIILLMATTGMRACDVVTLAIDDIDWHANEVAVRQEKTGVAVVLPLDVRAGEAIATYILEARRDCGERTVFTTTMGAARPLLATSINYIVRKYSSAADEAGFKGVHGPHAFRRGLGAAIVNSGSSLAEAADVLGHSRAESAMPYASMATERLRGCSVGLGDIPDGGKGADDGRGR